MGWKSKQKIWYEEGIAVPTVAARDSGDRCLIPERPFNRFLPRFPHSRTHRATTCDGCKRHSFVCFLHKTFAKSNSSSLREVFLIEQQQQQQMYFTAGGLMVALVDAALIASFHGNGFCFAACFASPSNGSGNFVWMKLVWKARVIFAPFF